MYYLEANKNLWNARTEVHINSEFYDLKGFISGKNSLKEIELHLLGDVQGKSILHLQCHFGQDTLSLSRMGAKVTGVDLSNVAIDKARELNHQLGTDAEFICCDIYDLKKHLDKKFDIVFTSYGAIGWIPDLDKWADIVAHYLKPMGEFVFVEFHPVVWIFDDEFGGIAYSYFNVEPIITESNGTYTDRDAPIKSIEYGWNHSLDEVITSLLKKDLTLLYFKEYNYSPYNCFRNMTKESEDRYYIEHLGPRIPMTYSLKARKG